MKRKKSLILILVLVSIASAGLLIQPSYNDSPTRSDFVDIGDGNVIEVNSDELLQSYTISSIPTTVEGVGSPLDVDEFSERTDSFSDIQLDYVSASQTTTDQSVSVPMGDLWEGTEMYLDVTDIQENRTWLTNYDFDGDASGWTLDVNDVIGYDNVLTSSYQSGYVEFRMDGVLASGYYRYNSGDRCYAEQSVTVDRGEVTWVGVVLDYWVQDQWAGLPVGFWELYLQAGGGFSSSRFLWSMLFSDALAENTWFSTGLVVADPALITTLSPMTIQVGVNTYRGFGCNDGGQDLSPEIRMDNIRVFIKTRAQPSEVGLNMNGQVVSDGATVGEGSVSQIPGTPWTTSPVDATFTWTPSDMPLDPDLDIQVSFSAQVTLWGHKLDSPTLYQAEVKSYGDYYSITNASDAQWTSYYYVSVPNGYSDNFYFNVEIPTSRTVDYVSQPRYPDENFPYWSTGVDYLNVSVYQNITGIYQNGFWGMQGHSSNIISDLQMGSPGDWSTSRVFQANDNVQFQATLDPAYNNAEVTFYVYDIAGELWTTLSATVSSGVAQSGVMILDPYLAETGQWTVHAFVDDFALAGSIHNVGFYAREFSVEHSASMFIVYPSDSIFTWEKNVTLGDDIILTIKVNDSDNSDLLPGGIANYNWTTGTQTLNDESTGTYSVLLDSTDLATPGRHVITITWSKLYYSSIQSQFVLNVIEETTIISEDADVFTPRGWDAVLEVFFFDSTANGISGATINCNWTDSVYSVVPVPGEPGHYTITIPTDNTDLGTYAVVVEGRADYYVTSDVTVFVQVRQLFTSVSLSKSYIDLPAGYQSAINVTYWDTEHNLPITGAESAISCNWSESHVTGDQNYTVTEIEPGKYEVVFYSTDADLLQTNTVILRLDRFATQNHSLTLTVEVQTRLTSLSLDNSVEPTPYAGHVRIYIRYWDETAQQGITNGSASGYNVLIYVTTPGIDPLIFTAANWTPDGHYYISIPANQWDTIEGWKDITVYANWTGAITKYESLSMTVSVRLTQSPSDLRLGVSPTSTPYGEILTFTIIYWDEANNTGIVNATGPYAHNVSIYVIVETLGHQLNQSVMTIIELGNGEYQISFSTIYISGLSSCNLRIYANWTKDALPLYENSTLLVTVETVYRQTIVEWTPMPVTAYDAAVNLTFFFKDVTTGSAIENDLNLYVSIAESGVFVTLYYNVVTREFTIAIDTTSWGMPGSFTFHLNVTWTGVPYYQNRTSVEIPITIRNRYTDLTHGSISPVQFDESLTIIFTFRDTDDLSLINTGDLTLDAWLFGHYTSFNNGDGTYTVELDSDIFGSTGVFLVNVSLQYTGSRFSEDGTDFFYFTIISRRTVLTSELPQSAPFLTIAEFNVTYTDDTSSIGIDGADIFAFCANATDLLVKDTNYWIVSHGLGLYEVQISTEALGNFGFYNVLVTANYSIGDTFYSERTRYVGITVIRRTASLSVSRSPVSTPFMENVTFDIRLVDAVTLLGIEINKTHLVLTHGAGIPILSSQFMITNISSESYEISIDSTVLTSQLTNDYPIYIQFFWGDSEPFYGNVTSSTKVTIKTRDTQASVLSTPPAYYFFDLTAILRYSDYLSSGPIDGADITLVCLNDSSIIYSFDDNTDGTYTIYVDTTSLDTLGRYFFEANITWVGSPFYTNQTAIPFSVNVNPVSTTLSFNIPADATYYVGDVVFANVTYVAIGTGTGITGADIATDWGLLFGTFYYPITEIIPGVYNLTITTAGLNAQLHTFNINGSKFYHINHTITADIFLASAPVEIALEANPSNPYWGDVIGLVANVTDARTSAPILNADVSILFAGDLYNLTEHGGGLYNISIPTSVYTAGEFTMTVTIELLNYETRQKDFQIRVAKLDSEISADLSPIITVNGQFVTIQANYTADGTGLPVTTGIVTYSWIGGSGTLNWSVTESMFIQTFTVSDVPVGSHQILVQASSENYRSVYAPLTIEIREINTQLVAYDGISTVSVIAGDILEVIVYLNNTDLSEAVEGASLSYSISNLTGYLTDIGGGYYTAYINSSPLSIRDWPLRISSQNDGYSPSDTQFTVTVLKVPTDIVILDEAFQEAFYGEIVTYRFEFINTHTSEGVVGAEANYLLDTNSGSIVDMGDGTYVLTLDTSVVFASTVTYDVSITFLRESHEFAFSTVRLRVNPIETSVTAPLFIDVPITDGISQSFQLNDLLHGTVIDDASASVVWDLGLTPLINNGDGTYTFQTSEDDLSRLELGRYDVKIVFTRGNYSQIEWDLEVLVRTVATSFTIVSEPAVVIVDSVFHIDVRFFDEDHQIPIEDALYEIPGQSLLRAATEEQYLGNGTYRFGFNAPTVGLHDLVILLDKDDHEQAIIEIDIYADLSAAQLQLVTTFTYATIGILLAAIVGAFYVRIWSVPKLLRMIRKMVSRLAGGNVPSPANVRTRQELLLVTINEDLSSVGIEKTIDDVALSTVDVSVLDVEQLLDELATVVGLGDEDIAVLRRDLDKMRPSDRAGFLNEVLKQERSRRAKELAAVDDVEVPVIEDKMTDEEIDDLRRRFIQLGIDPDEAELMVEQAKNLSKAEVQALLDQIGGGEE